MRTKGRWRRATEQLVGQLEGGTKRTVSPVSFDSLATLPAPVQRYFRLVLRDGQPRIRSARVRQAGTFRSRTGGDPEAGWSRFTATQCFTTDPPGFVWDAKIRMAPLVSVRVRDGYVAGHASMRAAAASLIPVMDAADDPGLRAGALQRYLAEAVWFPTALLPGQGLTWTAMDDRRSRATLTDAGTTVALEFEFGLRGEIVAAFTPGRPRAVPGRQGEYLMAPWGGRYQDYEEQHGMRVPVAAAVYWVLDGLEQLYYRGRNIALEYEFEGSEEEL